jgi:hypothetical protein
MNKDIKFNKVFNWKFLFGLLISIIFSYFAFQEFNLKTLFSLIGSINQKLILLGVLFLIFSVYLRALRWKLLFRYENISTKVLFDTELIGYFGNNILPLRLGEFLRCVLVSKKYRFKKSYVFGTIVLERFLDIFGLLFICILLLALDFSLLFNFINRFNVVYILLLIPVVLLILFFFNKMKKDELYQRNKIVILIFNIIDGFSSVNKKNIFPVIFYTLFIWLIYVLEVYLVQLSINLDLSINQCMFLLIISTLALSIPSAPANIGTFELSIVLGMQILGLSNNSSEFSVLLHSLTFVPYTILGGILFIYNYFYIFKLK